MLTGAQLDFSGGTGAVFYPQNFPPTHLPRAGHQQKDSGFAYLPHQGISHLSLTTTLKISSCFTAKAILSLHLNSRGKSLKKESLPSLWILKTEKEKSDSATAQKEKGSIYFFPFHTEGKGALTIILIMETKL